MLKVTVFCADDDDAGQAFAGVDLNLDDNAIQANDSICRAHSVGAILTEKK